MKRLALIVGLTISVMLPKWCDATYSGYQYQRTLTIAHAQVPNSDQTNFPVLISTNDVTLSTGTGGHLSNSNGYDLIFSTMSDCSYLLNWDTETVNNTGSATLNVWVKVPTVKTASDTTLYLCYGNSSITTYQGVSASAWDSNFKGVWHLQETGTGAAGDYKDSTTNGNNSNNTTGEPSKTTGIIASAQSFNGSSSLISVPSSARVRPTTFGSPPRRLVQNPCVITATSDSPRSMGRPMATGIPTTSKKLPAGLNHLRRIKEANS